MDRIVNVEPLKTDRSPLYRQVEQHLAGLVRQGVYAPGEQLPAEVVLAEQLGVSRPTLREALRNLERVGLIVRRHGVGTFVSASAIPKMESGLESLESVLAMADRQGMATQVSDLSVTTEAADDEMVARLGVEKAAPLTVVRRVLEVAGTPAAYMVDLAPRQILPAGAIESDFAGSVLDLLRGQKRVSVSHALAHIVAVDADGDLSARLAVEPGQALLLLEETLFDEEGAPFEFSRNYFIPECFRFQVVRR